MRAVADLATRHADALAKTAEDLRHGQARLNEAYARASGTVQARWLHDGSKVIFYPKDQAQINLVNGAIAEGKRIRQEVDGDLVIRESALAKLRGEWDALATAWAGTVLGVAAPFILPPEAAGTMVLTAGDQTIINTGPGDDKVAISVDPKTGEQVVVVNGVTYRYPAGQHITVRAGDGADEVNVAPGTKVNLTLLGGGGDDKLRAGEGNDTILGLDGKDTVYGGAGNDRASGGAGRDYLDGYQGDDVLTGGEGDDTVYGLSGADQISGGAGRDYLEGGAGDDRIDGGAGQDVLSGGRDNDVLTGGGDADRLYSGHGADRTHGGSGTDISYAEKSDSSDGAEQVVTVEIKDVGATIKIEGSDEFKERMQADIDMLRSSPVGQQMLAEMDKVRGMGGGEDHVLTIRQGDPAKFSSHGNTADDVITESGALWWKESHVNYVIDFYPEKGVSIDDRPPIVGLYHEMAHIYDYGNDTFAPGKYQGADNPGANNLERAAVGLPVDLDGDGVADGTSPVDLDGDGKPDGLDGDHPVELTENALRREMGWTERPRY